jgi:hypothetical protein
VRSHSKYTNLLVIEIVTALSSHVGCWRRSSGRSFIPIFKTLRASEKPQSIHPAREQGRPALRELSSHWMNHEYFLPRLRSGSSSGHLVSQFAKCCARSHSSPRCRVESRGPRINGWFTRCFDLRKENNEQSKLNALWSTSSRPLSRSVAQPLWSSAPLPFHI